MQIFAWPYAQHMFNFSRKNQTFYAYAYKKYLSYENTCSV